MFLYYERRLTPWRFCARFWKILAGNVLAMIAMPSYFENPA